MATNVYTSDYTLAAVKRRALIPGTGRVTESDLLGFINDATQDYIVPLLMGSREGYLHATEDTALVADQINYAFPRRAAAERLVRVALVDADDNETPLNRVETARRELGQSGFELVDNTIVLREMPTGFVTLRVTYFCEPSRLVPLDECARVTAKTSTVLTVDALPAAFSTSEPVDFIAGTPGFRWRALDKTPTATTSTSMTFASGVIPSTLVVGDYVALAGETPIVQVPKTLRPLVEQRAVCLALEALGDGRLKQAQTSLADMEKRIVPTLASRVPGSPRVIVNRFTTGSLRRNLPTTFWR